MNQNDGHVERLNSQRMHTFNWEEEMDTTILHSLIPALYTVIDREGTKRFITSYLTTPNNASWVQMA